MRNAIKYKDVWLCKGSEAYDLHEKGDFKKLDEHMKLLDQKFRALHGLPQKERGP